MKTLRLHFLAILIVTGTALNAQRGLNDADRCFNENSHIINVGVGLGRYYYAASIVAGSVYHSTPAFSISYEQAYKKKLGPGYLGVGAYFGFQSSYYRYDYNNY